MLTNPQRLETADWKEGTGPKRLVKFGIVDTETGDCRAVEAPLDQVPAVVDGLCSTEMVISEYPGWEDEDTFVGGLVILEARAIHRETLGELHERVERHVCRWLAAAAHLMQPRYEHGILVAALFVVAIDDPGDAASISAALVERARCAGIASDLSGPKTHFVGRFDDWARLEGLAVEVTQAGIRVVYGLRVAEGVRRGPPCKQWKLDRWLLTYDYHLDEPIEDEKLAAIERLANQARSSVYQRCASLLGSAEPVFGIAMRDLTGVALFDELTNLERAASNPDALVSVFRSTALLEAWRYRDLATDRARFEIAITAKLQQHEWYAHLAPVDASIVNLAAWLYAAPASVFVGKGGTNVGKLIQPGRADRREAEWLLDGLWPRVGVGALIGEAGCGKTQIAGDAASRIATLPKDGTARFFAGREVHGAASVLYFASEGVPALLDRLGRQIPAVCGRAANEPHGLHVGEGVPLLSSPIAALTCVRGKVLEIRERGSEPPALIVIDVLRAAVAGNEDNSGDMELALSTAWAIARMCECFVLLIHHSRKARDDDRQIVARGSSAIKANLDFEGTVAKLGRRDMPTYRLTVAKNRYGAEGYSFDWHIPGLDQPFVEGPARGFVADEERGVVVIPRQSRGL